MHEIVKRPWGQFEQFTLNETSTVKLLMVNREHRLSYQSHKNRSERWYCISGQVSAVVDGRTFALSPGESLEIPVGAKHRLIGVAVESTILEISFGTFTEDDIERFEDDYGRVGVGI